MVRRTFVSPSTPELENNRPKRSSVAPQFVSGLSAFPAPPPLPHDERRSSVVSNVDGVPAPACAQVLDRLASSEQAAFVASWIENVSSSRGRIEPSLAVRLLRAYRETNRFDRARDFAASLPPAPSSWPPLDAIRLSVERALLAIRERQLEHAAVELRFASRTFNDVPRGAGLREQLDIHVAQAHLDVECDRFEAAAEAIRLAEHFAERIEDGPWRASVATVLGDLSMRIADPRAAARNYTASLVRVPARSAPAATAHSSLALAFGSVGRYEDARFHALEAIAVLRELGSAVRHADAHDVLAALEIAADEPQAALNAVQEALGTLGDTDAPRLRYQLAEHRAWALAMLGREAPAAQWLAQATELRAKVTSFDALEEHELIAVRARVHECCGRLPDAIELAREHCHDRPEAFVTGVLNLTLGRCALASGDEESLREAVERAALAGDKHGWVFPDRAASAALWQTALRSGDSRVVRYAEKMLELNRAQVAAPAMPALRSMLPAPSIRPAASIRPLASMRPIPTIPPLGADALALATLDDEASLVYLTTASGVTRINLGDVAKATEGVRLVVDTLAHALRVDGREISLERRRALEPLVVQLLRRAREGLSADEILHAAGGPGPESADAEHRVRVLISRVRDLMAAAATIERVRDAGEHGKTRYRLASSVSFALVEPLSASLSP